LQGSCRLTCLLTAWFEKPSLQPVLRNILTIEL
jgi:hypothetical protein